MSKLFDMTDGEHEYVSSASRLNELCDQWSSLDAIAVDTEFMRTNTFYAKLGLLQISDGERAFLVDPLAIEHWEGFRRLCESDTLFVFHSCSEDLSVLLSHFGYLPKRLFDTQLAAAFLGEGASLSYAALVMNELQVSVDKGATRTDWLKRPLDPEQLRYAALDVAYLLPIQAALIARLKTAQLDHFFTLECEQLLSTAVAIESEQVWKSAYLNLSGAWKFGPAALLLLKNLCAWRESESRRRDKPKSWVAKDSDLLGLAEAYDRTRKDPRASDSIAELLNGKDRQAIDRRFVERNEKVLDRLLAEAANLGAEAIPAPAKPLDQVQRKTLKRLQSAVLQVAEQHSIGAEVLARKKHLLAFMEHSTKGEWPQELAVWKRPLLERALLDALSAQH